MLGNFGRSRHRITTKEHTNVTFEDVAGIEEAKEEVLELIEFLRNPKRFQKLGGRIPRGVLLIGEPGCGKTSQSGPPAAVWERVDARCRQAVADYWTERGTHSVN